MIYEIRAVDILGREVVHPVHVGDRRFESYAPDLRGIDLTNAWLRGANLSGANLDDAILLGPDLREASLCGASLVGADMRNTNLTKTDLRNADLRGVEMYPSETIGAHFYGAKFEPNSDAADYSRIAQQEICRRLRIKPGSVAYRKLRRINGWSEETAEFRESSPRTEIVRKPIDFLSHARIDAQIDKVGLEFSL